MSLVVIFCPVTLKCNQKKSFWQEKRKRVPVDFHFNKKALPNGKATKNHTQVFSSFHPPNIFKLAQDSVVDAKVAHSQKNNV